MSLSSLVNRDPTSTHSYFQDFSSQRKTNVGKQYTELFIRSLVSFSDRPTVPSLRLHRSIAMYQKREHLLTKTGRSFKRKFERGAHKHRVSNMPSPDDSEEAPMPRFHASLRLCVRPGLLRASFFSIDGQLFHGHGIPVVAGPDEPGQMFEEHGIGMGRLPHHANVFAMYFRSLVIALQEQTVEFIEAVF